MLTSRITFSAFTHIGDALHWFWAGHDIFLVDTARIFLKVNHRTWVVESSYWIFFFGFPGSFSFFFFSAGFAVLEKFLGNCPPSHFQEQMLPFRVKGDDARSQAGQMPGSFISPLGRFGSEWANARALCVTKRHEFVTCVARMRCNNGRECS